MAKRISKERFDVYAIGTRLSTIQLICEERSWWASLDETVIGTVSFHFEDQDYAWLLLARDENGKFRCANLGHSISTEKKAEAELRLKIEETVRAEGFSGVVNQYDDLSTSTNVLKPLTEEKDKLHPNYRHLIESDSAIPARAILREIGPCLHLQDNHFIKEFQFYQFDQRIWELYLWASFREQGFDIQHREAPDFELYSAATDLRFTIEATTVAPSMTGILKEHPNPKSKEEVENFLMTYMPIKFASPLTSKLNRVDQKGLRYWDYEHSKDKPFVLAIADFHKASNHETGDITSLVYSQSALYAYLYGKRVDWFVDDTGQLIITTADIENHQYKNKSIPSGFFDLPGAENISGVLFSNAGTLPKFNRMGVCAGFKHPEYKYFRQGFRYNPDSDAFMGIPFSVEVGSATYTEKWSDELQLFHNPNALHPIDPNDLRGIAHHNYIDGEFITLDSGNRVLSSITHVIHFKNEEGET